MFVDQFTRVFRGEHRQLRDTVLDLISAFQSHDTAALPHLIHQAIVCAGPHCRYEEDALYPALSQFFEPDYIEILLIDHDWMIGVMKQLRVFSKQAQLTDDDVQLAIRMARSMLLHISDCEGLSIMVERLSPPVVHSVLDARTWSLNEGLDLLQWAEHVRGRPYLSPQAV
ncbi:MAG: hemerythrin domain-containing protein [Chloroflexi bacterium]|nr:hemerythrin domain-containing protein [Chloroflexota bacterium]